MNENQIFEDVVHIVCEECGVSYGELINGVNKQAVDAKCMLICSLIKIGFTEETIASYLSMTRQGVNRLKNTLKSRCKCSFIFATKNQQISNKIATITKG